MSVNWHDIDCVLLDMDGTLLDLNFDNHFWQEHLPKRYAFSRGLDIPTSKKLLNRHFERTAGTLDWYCLDYWTQQLSLDISEMKRDVTHLIGLLDGAIEFMNALRASGKKSILVTNAHPKSLALKLEHIRLDQHLDHLISIHEFGTPKEDVLCWSKLQARLPFNPAKTLLIDDNLSVLRSAKKFGIAHLLAACKPDTKRPPQPTTEFNSFNYFRDIMPPK